LPVNRGGNCRDCWQQASLSFVINSRVYQLLWHPTAVLPGLTNTLATAPQSEEQKRNTWEQQAIKRLREPEDMTGAILYLTSDDAACITGQPIVMDGGQYRIG